VDDPAVFPFTGIWTDDGRRLGGCSGQRVAGPSNWDMIRDLETLERHIALHGYPWQPGYTGGDEGIGVVDLTARYHPARLADDVAVLDSSDLL
jgi:hypothetical protein